jgi:hypothetical protein
MSCRTHDILLTELATARTVFHEQLAATPTRALAEPSSNPAWTNGAVLFHMLLGFLVTMTLLPLVWGFSILPRPASWLFAALLNLSTPVFNIVNALGARGGGRILRRASFAALFNMAYAILVWALNRMTERQLRRRGMYFPNRWDGLFTRYMTLGDLIGYPARHLQFHVAQLTVQAGDHRTDDGPGNRFN